MNESTFVTVNSAYLTTRQKQIPDNSEIKSCWVEGDLILTIEKHKTDNVSIIATLTRVRLYIVVM